MYKSVLGDAEQCLYSGREPLLKAGFNIISRLQCSLGPSICDGRRERLRWWWAVAHAVQQVLYADETPAAVIAV